MLNLNDILQSAQGGQAINNLAQRFGISPDQAQAAVQALIPALSAGLAKCAAQPGALGSIISAITDPDHQASFSSSAGGQSPATAQKANDALSQILGSSNIVQQIAQQAARVTGLRPDLLAQMLPVVASMALGGIATSLRNQGLGSVLERLATAAQQGDPGAAAGSGGTHGNCEQPLGRLIGGIEIERQFFAQLGSQRIDEIVRAGRVAGERHAIGPAGFDRQDPQRAVLRQTARPNRCQLRLAATGVNFAESDIPIERAPATIAIEINPAISAYSIAVAARSSDRNRRMVHITASTEIYLRQSAWKKR